jgi:hypothetical protein
VINNLREGEWFERYSDKDFYGNVTYAYQIGSYKKPTRRKMDSIL